jgi:Polysaccharide pyruvyl transferase
MPTIFCVRPATRNIGNDVIKRATLALLYTSFGSDAGLIDIPALAGAQFGGLTSRQVYDMNRFADGIVVGGGNLLENGQITIEPQALAALRPPLMLVGLSHGRIYDGDGSLMERTDAMAPDLIRLLVAKSCVPMVRDRTTQRRLQSLGIDAEVAGCPTLFMDPNPPHWQHDETILVSVRHPARMSVPPPVQWRIAEELRRMIAALDEAFDARIVLACHDYADIEFASGFPEASLIYYDDVERYVSALRRCRLNVTYRLHAFLPCLAFGTPTIHLSYDERGRDMVATAGMGAWDVDILREPDVVEAVMSRARDTRGFFDMLSAAQPTIRELRQRTEQGLAAFALAVGAHATQRRGAVDANHGRTRFAPRGFLAASSQYLDRG